MKCSGTDKDHFASIEGINPQTSRRRFLTAGCVALAVPTVWSQSVSYASEPAQAVVRPASDRRILLSCKLTMIPKEEGGWSLSLAERLGLAQQAGFDGVDLDEAALFTPEQARLAVERSGVFVHNAINHDHWKQRLTSPEEGIREQARANLAHCMRVSHAAGGNGVLIVVGRGDDGPREQIEARCQEELSRLLPLAASLGQPILVENVWNKMFYEHDNPPEQSAERFVEFIDRFNSPWIGMYFDIGNHWKYGRPGDWIRQLGRRCVKLDVKGFSRAKGTFADIGEGDLPWKEVRESLNDIGYTGWATAEVDGGDLARLTEVRRQMETVFGLPSRSV